MPHIEIKCYAGRTEAQKKECADLVAAVVSEKLGCEVSHVSVAIKDVQPADWKEKVWDAQIVPDNDFLYKKPGYTYD